MAHPATIDLVAAMVGEDNVPGTASVPAMAELLGLDSLVAQMVLGLGAALILGNGFALYKHHKGERPTGPTGEFRRGRALFLIGVGVVIAIWGVASLAG